MPAGAGAGTAELLPQLLQVLQPLSQPQPQSLLWKRLNQPRIRSRKDSRPHESQPQDWVVWQVLHDLAQVLHGVEHVLQVLHEFSQQSLWRWKRPRRRLHQPSSSQHVLQLLQLLQPPQAEAEAAAGAGAGLAGGGAGSAPASQADVTKSNAFTRVILPWRRVSALGRRGG